MSNEMVTDPLPDTGEENISTIETHLQDDPLLYRITSQAPWWLVSVIFHDLLIVCAYMFSIAINIDTPEDALITVSVITRPVENEEKKPQPVATAPEALKGKLDTPATDPNSKESSEIEVPHDILIKAELSDRFQTINYDLPDTQSANGVSDAHMFHSIKGVVDKVGGGGTNGMKMEDVIGAGGESTRGIGGGWGGGKGPGIGNGDGPGRGSFSNRPGGGRKLTVPRHGSTKATENSVEAALRWLAYHQETDGHWDAKKYTAGEKTDTAVTNRRLDQLLGCRRAE